MGVISRLTGGKKPVNPPYFSGKFDCIGCNSPCVLACERNLLKFNETRVEFIVNDYGCNFCAKCADVCVNSVLSTENTKYINAFAKINVNSCLAWNDTVCYNCLDVCKYKAIEYFGVFRPVVNQNCIGCGECVGSCFVKSINLVAKKDL